MHWPANMQTRMQDSACLYYDMMLNVQNGLCMQQNMQTTYVHTAVILQSKYNQQTLSVSVTHQQHESAGSWSFSGLIF